MQAVEEFEAKHIYDLPTLLANNGNELSSSSHDLARPMSNVLISRRSEINSETSDVVNRSSERVDSTYEVISQYARPRDTSQPISIITAAATDTTLPPPMPAARRNVNGLHAVTPSEPKARSTVDDEEVEEHYGDAAAVASPVGDASKDKKPLNTPSLLEEFTRIIDELMPIDLQITKEIHAFFDSEEAKLQHNDFKPSAARPAVIDENQTHPVGPALPKRQPQQLPQHVASHHQDTHVDTQQASTYNSKLPADNDADDGTITTTTADAAGAGHVTSRNEQRARDNIATTITTNSSSSSSSSSSETRPQTTLYEELPATITLSSRADDIYANANDIEERSSQVPSKMHDVDVPSSADPLPLPSAHHPPLPSAHPPPRPEKKVISTKQLSNNGAAATAASPFISESMPCLSISSPASSLSPAAVDRDNKVKINNINNNDDDDGTVIAVSNNRVILTAPTPVATPTSTPFAGKANTIARVNNTKGQQEMTTSTAKDQRRPSADELSIGSSSSTVKKSLFNWKRNKLAAATNNASNTETGGLGLNSGADKSATIAKSTLSLSAGKKKDKHGDGGDAPGTFRRVMVSLFKKTSSADKVKVSANPKHVSAVGNQYTDAPVKQQQQQSSTDVDVGHDIYYQIHAGNEPSLSQLPPLLESEYQDVAVGSSPSSRGATADVGARQSSVIDNDLYQDILTTLPSAVTTADKVGSVIQADDNRNNSNSRSAVHSVSVTGQAQGEGEDKTITTRVDNKVVSPVAKKPSITKSAPQAHPFHNQQHQQVQEQPEQYQSEIYEKLQYEVAASSVNNNNNNIKLSGDVSAANSSMDNALYYQDHDSVRDSHEYAFLNELIRAADIVATYAN